jgi:hypothetical protein
MNRTTSGQFDSPVGKLEAERIPAFAAPTLTHLASFENDMLAFSLAEKVTHRQAGVATADDNRLQLLHFSSHKPAPLFP